MNRRETIIALVALDAVSIAVQAQRATGVPRIGYLSSNLVGSPDMTEGFRQGLRDLGYVEGRNVVIEIRDADGKLERLPVLAAELVALKVDVIVVGGTSGALAAKRATRAVPVVFVSAVDPVTDGLVSSLAQPGGNVTGLPSRGSARSLSSGSQVPSANAQSRTCERKQKSRHGRWGCDFNSSRRKAQAILTGPSRR